MTVNLFPSYQQLPGTLLAIWISGVAYVVMKGWKSRSLIYRLRKDPRGLPIPKWNPITGHLLTLAPYAFRLPTNAHQNYILAELAKEYPQSDSAIYLDIWPFIMPILLISSPSLAIQACQKYDLEKPKSLTDFFLPFAGSSDHLFTSNGPEWKNLRSIFNPGFSANYLMTQMDHIIEETTEYVSILREYAEGNVMFSLDELLCDFTMDIIGAVRWHIAAGEFNPFKRFNPIKPLVQWKNGRLMDDYISKELDKRFADRQQSSATVTRSIIDLVLEEYMSRNPEANKANQMNPAFKKWATVQIRLFLFAGHDSTATSLCYTYHLLSQNPGALQRIRAEHDEAFGTDLSTVATQLLDHPRKINTAGIRTGTTDAVLQDDDGNEYPTEGTAILILHNAIHRNPKYWKDPDSFLPERWLVGPEDPLYPVKGAWRPFEFGPRNCIGQTLVMQDMKTVLVMTLREFDICNAYDDGMNHIRGRA
ncbi:related to cytochrome P450 CYP4/CYP19/CYP26 subfamilies [Rhynchosporium secalis]|uniref:Related to cytochrome P450 CYP4/CYP19/CYP26 subfamilies n=1 Tax=Rhynchosporium secalis TaxID=38038 RepID=A0A1E1M551_RHYSE|nr:related to cytochrome P450 CYP4/CYP19/CYP26 subfamilies [Rhynchosporium secalis]